MQHKYNKHKPIIRSLALNRHDRNAKTRIRICLKIPFLVIKEEETMNRLMYNDNLLNSREDESVLVLLIIVHAACLNTVFSFGWRENVYFISGHELVVI